MINIVQSSIFRSEAQTLVNAVNCSGIMGAGLAKQFKLQFPNMYADYETKCGSGIVKVGEPYLFSEDDYPWIINFPTKEFWRAPSDIRYIESGLDYLIAKSVDWGIESIACPPLGCGLGGLDWRVVGPLIYDKLGVLGFDADLFPPTGLCSSLTSSEFLSTGKIPLVEAGGKQDSAISDSAIAMVEALRRVSNEVKKPNASITFRELVDHAQQAKLYTIEQNNLTAKEITKWRSDLKSKLTRNGLIEMSAVKRSGIEGIGKYYDYENWSGVVKELASQIDCLQTLLRGNEQQDLF